MIIDSHIHLYNPDIQPDVNPDYLEQLTSEFVSYGAYLRLCFTPTKYNHTRQGWATCDRMIEIMDEEGIDKVAVVGPEDDYLAKVHHQYPERILPFFRVSVPDLRENLNEEINKMRHFIKDEGFYGFGEFHPDIDGYNLYSKEVLAVMELAQELDVPVNIHVSEPVGHFYYGKSQNPFDEYYWLAKRYPELKLILAHWGGGICFYESIPHIREAFRNVYYDTTASKLFFDTTKSIETITKIVNTQKIFYGSDYPLLLHPDMYPDEMNPRFIWDRNDYLQAEIPAHILDGIMGDNFASFLGLQIEGQKAQKKRSYQPSEIVFEINKNTSLFELTKRFPETATILKKHGLPYRDVRVPQWLALIQSLAQKNIWYEDGFIQEMRDIIPSDNPLQKMEDLDLVHESTRQLALDYPKIKELLIKYDIDCEDSPLPSWKTIEQAAFERGIINLKNIIGEIQQLVNEG